MRSAPQSGARAVPTLQELASAVVARRIEHYDCPSLPYGAGPDFIRRLAADRRLRAETLAPLLRSAQAVDDLEECLGAPLARMALGCHGAAALAAQLLASREALAERRREGRVAQQLPDGTRLAVPSPGAVPWDHGSCDLRVEARR